MGDPVFQLTKVVEPKTIEDKDFAITNQTSLEDSVLIFNQSDSVTKNKFKLYFWTFNNAARHFTASWRWSDNTINQSMLNETIGHNCKNISYEYADIKIKLKNKSYSSFGSIK